MSTSTLTIAVALILSSLSQPIQKEEVDYQSENFKNWWAVDLEWRFDELPTEGGVPQFRIPYSGYIYPDKDGGTTQVLAKYDRAFNQGRNLAAAHEQRDVTAQQELRYERRGLFGLRRVGVYRTPGWHGHCNGWTASAIRHAEPQTSVTRHGVTFSPADIKALLADTYMYSDQEFLGGIDDAMNPGTLHVILANWLGRGNHPVGMEATVGPEKWNYPAYAYATSSTKRSERQVEVQLRLAYADSTQREYNRSPQIKRVKHFHYMLDLDEEGKIVGGRYYSDSQQIDMLWTPLKPTRIPEDEKERVNPHLDAETVLAIWRDSVPESLRKKWYNIDPTEEDRIVEEDSASEGASEEPNPEDEIVTVDESPQSRRGVLPGNEEDPNREQRLFLGRPRPTTTRPLFGRLFGRR